MNVAITLDYEIFFGPKSGSVERSVLEPSEALAALAARYRVPLVFFVDACWLLRLRQQARSHPALGAEHDRVCRQLARFVKDGHELQVHVHPHWHDSWFDGERWHIDLRRYRLDDFGTRQISEIIAEAADLLREIADGKRVSAFRAGGWCIQPFNRLRRALLESGIYIDSTVYAGGRQTSASHRYDFTGAPSASRWFFDHDPLQPDDEGPFLEVPIASHRVSPLFYWKFAAARKLGWAGQQPFGDGVAVPLGRDDLINKLLRPTPSVVSIDGMKADFLETAWREYAARDMEDFVVIGHPKAFTRGSLARLEAFLQAHRDLRYLGMNDYLDLPAPGTWDDNLDDAVGSDAALTVERDGLPRAASA